MHISATLRQSTQLLQLAGFDDSNHYTAYTSLLVVFQVTENPDDKTIRELLRDHMVQSGYIEEDDEFDLKVLGLGHHDCEFTEPFTNDENNPGHEHATLEERKTKTEVVITVSPPREAC